MKLPIITPAIRMVAKIISFAVYLLTVIAGYCGLVNPDHFALPAMITLAFPWLALLSIIITILWFCTGRWITASIGLLALVAVGGPLAQAVPFKFPKKAKNPDQTFSVLTFNILHGDDYRHPDSPGNRSIEYLIASGADIVCLQELVEWSPKEIKNFTPSLRDSLFAVYPYRGGDARSDLKVLSKYPLRPLDVHDLPKEAALDPYRAHFQFFEVNVRGHKLNVVTMHMNSYNLTEEERKVVTEINSVGSAKESYRELKGDIRQKMAQSFRHRKANTKHLLELLKPLEGPTIVCGDFNDVPASYAYRMMKDDGFRDAFAETHFLPTYTYNAHLFLLHLDQIFYRGPLRALCVKRGSIDSSDHYPQTATFEFTNFP